MPALETGSGIKLSYTLHSGDSPDTIVLLHGLGANKETFKDIINYPELAEKSILAMDHVGHGDSSSPEDFSYTDVLKLAIAKESAAFKLYVDLLRLTEDPEAIEMFTALAEDEVRHKIKFESTYEKYTRRKR